MAAAMPSRTISRSEICTWGLPDSMPRSSGSPKCTKDQELREQELEEGAENSLDQSFSSVDSNAHEGGWPHAAIHVRDLDDVQLEELWPRGPELKALFLDYDGTLREFESLPELAVPTDEIHTLLRALCQRQDLRVHIISGRGADFLTTHFGAHPQLTLLAEHERRLAGRFQIWRPGGGPTSPTGAPAAEEWKQLVRPEIEKFVAQLPGSHFEEKASALVWHHRGVANKALGDFLAGILLQQVERMREEQGGALRGVKVSLGHKTVEVSSRGVSKGEVMSRICKDRASAHGPFKAVLCAGDDVSDESMFANAPQEYLTVKVGSAQTRARFRVDSPEELRGLLWRIAVR